MNPSFLTGTVKALDTASDPGEFEVILSTPSLDRDGEIIDAGAFNPLPDHITFDSDHGMSTFTTVGSGKPTYDGDKLKVRGTFSSIRRAQDVRALVAEGHIRTTSVAYMTPQIEVKDGVRHIVKAELLNGSFVPVPSNRDARVIAAKSTRGPAALPGLKAIAGSYEERRDQIAQAVRLANPDAWWTYIIATFDSSVVYEVEGRDSTDRFEADYEVTDTGDVTLTNLRPVEVVEVIEPAKTIGDAVTAAVAPFLKTGARNSASDLELLQSAHDSIAALGADCATTKSPPDAPEDKAAAPAPASPPAAVRWARALATTAEAEVLLA